MANPSKKTVARKGKATPYKAPTAKTALTAAPKPKRKKVAPEIVGAAPTTEAQAAETVEIAPEKPAFTFSDLNLDEPIARAVKEMGFETPTPIQERAVPILMAGHDLIGQAQTGTGKTAAFALPLLHKVTAESRDTQALVLAPTRELAVQVAEGIYNLSKHTDLRIVPIYGGQPFDRQYRALHMGAQVVVGTPGRVLDHIRRGSLSLANVKFCALDEADEMLTLGFLDDIEAILSELPAERQTAFFSATIPPRVQGLMKKYLREPKQVSIEAKQRTLDSTNQSYYEVETGKKLGALVRVLDMETPGPTIIFCRTRQITNDLAEDLRVRGYGAEALHGDMTQSERERVLRRFRDGISELLVATDVAARGLDIDTVTHVINFDVPFDVEQYIHRIGRTGRAGRSGDAITFVSRRERRQLGFIERAIGAKIEPLRLPTPADIAARRREVFKDSLRATLDAGNFDAFFAPVEELSEDFEISQIAAAALQMLWQNQHGTPTETAQEMAADGEQPEAGMARIFVGLGRQEDLKAGDLVAAIGEAVGLTSKEIGAIDILDHSTFLEVPKDRAVEIIAALRRTKLRGKKPNVQFAATPTNNGAGDK